MNKFDRIYVCNYTPLKNRKEHMIEQCKRYNIEDTLIFIHKYDREHIPRKLLQIFDTNKLKMSEISLFLKHMYSMGGILHSNKPYGIIMEDDVIFKDNFLENFNKITAELPKNFDILHVGVFPFQKEFIKQKGRAHPIPKNAKRVGYFRDMSNTMVFPWTGNNKGTDFYIISNAGCRKFMQLFNYWVCSRKKIHTPIDYYMGQMMLINKCNIWWCDREITIHGSYSTRGGQDKITGAKFNSSIV